MFVYFEILVYYRVNFVMVFSYVILIIKLDVKKKVGFSREFWVMRDIDFCYESIYLLGYNVCRFMGLLLYYVLFIYEV